jgi:ankyrin repeat protein
LQLQPAVFRLLLDARADARVYTEKVGDSALSLAAVAEHGCPGAVVKLLLRAKANVHDFNASCYTALHRAAAYGRRSTVNLLLRAKADVHAVTEHGETAATVARLNAHIELAAYLDTFTRT